MIKEIRFVILKLRETYNRRMWHYCIGRAKKYECDRDYKESYFWAEKSRIYLDTQRFVTERLRSIDM